MWTLWITLVVVLLGYMWSRRKLYFLAWKLGGPIGLPFLGNLQFLRPEGLFRFFNSLNKNHKTPTVIWFGPLCILCVDDAETAERIFKAPECVNKSVLYQIVTKVLGEGLGSYDNPKWTTHRKLLNPVLMHRNLLGLFSIFNGETDVFCNKLAKFADTNESPKILDMVQKFTLSVACQTTMGKRMNIQDDADNAVSRAYNFLIHATSKVVDNPIYAIHFLAKFYDPKFYKTWLKSWAFTRNFVHELVLEKLSQQDQSNNTKKEDNDSFIKSESIFIDYVVDLLKKELFSLADVIDESNHIIIAAFESTRVALYHTIVLLAINTKWQEKLHEEIKQVFPDKEFEVVYENLENLPLTEMIINESLRLLPVAPIIARIAESDFQLRDDVVVPKGTNIALNFYAIHINSKYWGPNPQQFNPDHFLPDAVNNRHPYAFLPFSKGSRNCIGWRYAYLFIKVAVAKIFRNFRFTTTSKMEDMELIFDVVTKLKTEPVLKIYSIQD